MTLYLMLLLKAGSCFCPSPGWNWSNNLDVKGVLNQGTISTTGGQTNTNAVLGTIGAACSDGEKQVKFTLDERLALEKLDEGWQVIKIQTMPLRIVNLEKRAKPVEYERKETSLGLSTQATENSGDQLIIGSSTTIRFYTVP